MSSLEKPSQSPSSLSKPSSIAATVSLDPDPDPPPVKSTDSPGFLWKNLFADVESPSFPSSSPSYLPDGTPVVLAPKSVLLKASSSWSGHLLCRFMGEPPSPAKFFSDLNRVWGKHGDISVRRFSSGTFLVYVPSSSTRKWILQTGLWSSGMVSFVVSEWSVNPSLAPLPKLTSATTVLTIRDIPPQLWSHEAVARIAGAVAKLIPGNRASLPLSSLGTATIRAIVPLGSSLPSSVLVKDTYGDSVLVSIDYGRLPHLCSNCKSYGHQVHRCPSRHSAEKSSPPLMNSNSDVLSEPASRADLPETVCANTLPSQVKTVIQHPETSNQDMEIEGKSYVSTLSNSSKTQTDIQNPEIPQGMVLDNIGSDELVSECVPRPHLVPKISDQDMVLDNENCDILVSECISSSLPAPTSSTPVSEAPIQVSSPPPEVSSGMKQDLTFFSLPLPIQIEPSEMNQLPSQSCTELSSDQSSVPAPSSFSYPPQNSHALKPEPDHTITSPLLEVTSASQPSRKASRAKGQKGGSCYQRQVQQVINSTLKCKVSSQNFKSKGVVEKRKKQAQKELWSDYEDLQPCIQEMENDKKNSMHFEALRAFKILQNSDTSTPNTLET